MMTYGAFSDHLDEEIADQTKNAQKAKTKPEKYYLEAGMTLTELVNFRTTSHTLRGVCLNTKTKAWKYFNESMEATVSHQQGFNWDSNCLDWFISLVTESTLFDDFLTVRVRVWKTDFKNNKLVRYSNMSGASQYNYINLIYRATTEEHYDAFKVIKHSVEEVRQ